VGLLLMVLRRLDVFIFLAPLLAVGGLSIFASRFILFLVPSVALGICFLMAEILKLVPRKAIWYLFCCVTVAYSSYQSVLQQQHIQPVFSQEIIDGMKLISRQTKKNSVIFSWWDAGHLLVYYGERATLADGAYHSPERNSYLALPMALDNQHQAASFIRFFATHGIQGFHRFYHTSKLDREPGLALLKVLFSLEGDQRERFIAENLPLFSKSSSGYTLQQWLDFLFPTEGPDVYLFLYKRNFGPNAQRIIYWYGTWNTGTKSGIKTLPSIEVAGVPIDYEGRIEAPDISINYVTGTLEFSTLFRQPLELDTIVIHHSFSPAAVYHFRSTADPRTIRPIFASRYSSSRTPHIDAEEGNYQLDVFPEQNKLVLKDLRVAKMVSQQLFLPAYSSENSHSFSLVSEDPASISSGELILIPLKNNNQPSQQLLCPSEIDCLLGSS
jgi:hypothetical protein